MEHVPVADWRNADKIMWDKARWINGIEAAHAGIIEPGKIIVCGHWHCSFGHSRYENDGGESIIFAIVFQFEEMYSQTPENVFAIEHFEGTSSFHRWFM